MGSSDAMKGCRDYDDVAVRLGWDLDRFTGAFSSLCEEYNIPVYLRESVKLLVIQLRLRPRGIKPERNPVTAKQLPKRSPLLGRPSPLRGRVKAPVVEKIQKLKEFVRERAQRDEAGELGRTALATVVGVDPSNTTAFFGKIARQYHIKEEDPHRAYILTLKAILVEMGVTVEKEFFDRIPFGKTGYVGALMRERLDELKKVVEERVRRKAAGELGRASLAMAIGVGTNNATRFFDRVATHFGVPKTEPRQTHTATLKALLNGSDVTTEGLFEKIPYGKVKGVKYKNRASVTVTAP